MNKNMSAIVACIEGLRNLDNWPESMTKDYFLKLRSAFDRENSFSINFENIPETDFSTALKKTIRYADPLGRPISLFEWMVCSELIRRNVAEDVFNRGEKEVCISTVWLGLNHSHFGGLLIFETMIFGAEDSPEFDGYQERYSTLSEAEEGHDLAVQLVHKYFDSHVLKDESIGICKESPEKNI